MRRGCNFGSSVGGWFLAGCAVLGLGLGSFTRGEQPVEAKAIKVVVHINFDDATRQGDALNNVQNVLKAAEAEGLKAEVEIVCHSAGITLVEKSKRTHARLVESLQKKGVEFKACRNTMKQRSLREDDLLERVTTVTSGAFEVIRRQHDGFAYFKP